MKCMLMTTFFSFFLLPFFSRILDVFDIHRVKFKELERRLYLNERHPVLSASSHGSLSPDQTVVHVSIQPDIYHVRGAYQVAYKEILRNRLCNL